MILKLYNNWIEKANEKIYNRVKGLRTSRMSKTQIKNILKLIKEGKIIKSNNDYIIYEIK